MQLRVDQLVPYGYTDSTIATFHAFGDRIIREFAFELGLPSDVRVLSRPETVIFLREHLFDFELDAYRPLGDPTRFLGALATLFSRCKDEDISPADYLAYAQRLADAAVRTARELARREQRQTADRIRPTRSPRWRAASWSLPARTRATRSCCTPPGSSTSATRSAWRCGCCANHRRRARRSRTAIRYVLVDEFQDTNRAQAELVSLIAERHGNITRRRRRRPVDLHVPRRGDQQHPRVRGAPRAAPPTSSCAELPVARADPRREPSPDPLQRPGPPRDPGRHQQAAATGAARSRRGPGPARGLRDRRRRGRLDRRARSAVASPTGRAPRDHAVLVRTNAAADAGPAQPQHRRHPVAVQRHLGPVRPPRGPAAAVGPAGRRGPVVERGRLRPRGVGGLRARRRGPDGDRQFGAAPQSDGLGDPRGARAPAGAPPPLTRPAGPRSRARRRPRGPSASSRTNDRPGR